MPAVRNGAFTGRNGEPWPGRPSDAHIVGIGWQVTAQLPNLPAGTGNAGLVTPSGASPMAAFDRSQSKLTVYPGGELKFGSSRFSEPEPVGTYHLTVTSGDVSPSTSFKMRYGHHLRLVSPETSSGADRTRGESLHIGVVAGVSAGSESVVALYQATRVPGRADQDDFRFPTTLAQHAGRNGESVPALTVSANERRGSYLLAVDPARRDNRLYYTLPTHRLRFNVQ